MVFWVAPSCESLDPKDFPNLKTKVIKAGNGEQIVSGSDFVKLHYLGRLKNGQIFDSSYKRKKPTRFSMQSITVIKGWKVGIIGMREGEVRRLIVPPELAFGEAGKGDRVPPNSTVTFDIKLLKIN